MDDDAYNLDPTQLQEPVANRRRNTLRKCCTPFTKCLIWVNRVDLKLRKYGSILTFVVLMCSLALAHGIVSSYFRKTIKVWTQHYGFSSKFAEWLSRSDDIFGGLLALAVAHFGYVWHRPRCLAILVIFHWLAALSLAIMEAATAAKIPEELTAPNSTKNLNLCITNIAQLQTALPTGSAMVIAAISLFFYQFCFSLSTVSFISHGITYVVDHVRSGDCALYVGMIFVCREIGKQMGVFLSWIPLIINPNAVFYTSVWLATTCLIFASGILILLMYPKKLPSLLAEEVPNNDEFDVLAQITKRENKEFRSIFCSITQNRLLWYHIIAFVLANAVNSNFSMVKSNFLRAKTYMSDYDENPFGYNDALHTRIIAQILKQYYIITAGISCSMIVAKFYKELGGLAMWNMLMLILMTSFYFVYYFLECELSSKKSIFIYKDSMLNMYGNGTHLDYYCNRGCNCASRMKFLPVCTEEGRSYFSPCYAGCTSVENINNDMIYTDCRCGKYSEILYNASATGGVCMKRDCKTLAMVLRGGVVACYGVTTATLVPFIMILLKHVRIAHKGVALGLTYTLLGTIPYIMKLIIDGYVALSCEFSHNGNCLLHTRRFATYLPLGLAGVSAAATICAFIVMRTIDKPASASRRRQPYYDELLPEEVIDPAEMRALTSARNYDSDSDSSDDVHVVEKIGADVHEVQSPAQRSTASTLSPPPDGAQAPYLETAL